MNNLFIHNPVFRLLSPLFSGVLVYLLILLVNNNVGQLQEEFLSQELYVCIVLAYIIQEYARFSLFFFERLSWLQSFIGKIIFQLIISILISILLVSTLMYLYFDWVLGFTPNLSELTLFNSIFSVITLIYLSLYLSHQFLHKANTKIIEQELFLKESLDQDFVHFKKGINPTLLFESLESLILLIKKDAAKAERLVDHFSSVYRYILSKTKKEIVPLKEELSIIDELLLLFEHLPYRKTSYTTTSTINTLVVPGSILTCMEQIIRSTIVSKEVGLSVEIFEDDSSLFLKYAHQNKITQAVNESSLKGINDIYRFYTNHKIILTKNETYTKITIPKLTIHESSDY